MIDSQTSRLITDSLWNSTMTLLCCFILLSLLTYKAGKDRIFLFYCSYNFLLLLYIASKASIFNVVEGSHLWVVKKVFNWHIQIIYHFFHLYLGIIIVGIDTKFPKLYRSLRLYGFISLSVGTLLALLVIAGVFDNSFYDAYFIYLHIPVFLMVAVIILYRAWREKGIVILCFFWGTLIYAVLASLSLILTVLRVTDGFLFPIAYFFIGIIIEVTAFAVGLGFRIRNVYKEKIELQKRENIKLSKEKEMQEFETEIALLQNKVLRSQMNSHFIFNVLNSIKTFIIEDKERDAVNYLNKFSKFIRKILDSNFYEINTIEEEINTLKLYLEIESMRLHHNFKYHIEVDESINTKEVKFPSLLLQPYVENAIWHGLMPQKDGKRLNIYFEKISDGIKITIDDNGIGYKESLKNKSEQTNHKSFGINIVNQRIQEFNQRNKESIYTVIKDKSDFNEKGTIVEIYLQLNAAVASG